MGEHKTDYPELKSYNEYKKISVIKFLKIQNK